jgi:hypothetical protein
MRREQKRGGMGEVEKIRRNEMKRSVLTSMALQEQRERESYTLDRGVGVGGTSTRQRALPAGWLPLGSVFFTAAPRLKTPG